MTIKLRGITWGHTRGFLPMLATAQRFRETYAGVRIEWEIRSLQEFADLSIEDLAARYDLLVIDHPFAGRAARGDVLLPLDEWIDDSFLQEQEAHSAGQSHASYLYDGHAWALAIDAATPVSGWRSDLLELAGVAPPATWSELLALARRGLVTLPAVPQDCLMHFYMLCGALGEDPFLRTGAVVNEEIGIEALEMLRELLLLCGGACLSMNPIAVWELLSSSDKAAYCPFAYGYSNYSRDGYAPHVLSMGPLVKLENGAVLRSTLGGAGLAVSTSCSHKAIAAEYARFVAGERCQRRLYFDSGGQPGHLAAWIDTEVNRRSNNFFRSTLGTLQDAYLRPRFDGYIALQEKLCAAVHRYLMAAGPAKETVAELNELATHTQLGPQDDGDAAP